MSVMLISSGTPQSLWGEVIITFNYILNKVPNKKLKKTSYEFQQGKRSSYKQLKVWECLTNIAIPYPKKFKIGLKIIDCVNIRYEYNSGVYQFFVHKLNVEDIHHNTIMESRNAIFLEDVFPWIETQESHSYKRTIEASSTDHHQLEDDEVKLKRSKKGVVVNE